LTPRPLLRLLAPSLRAAGLLRAAPLLAAVRALVGPVALAPLPLPSPAVAPALLAGPSVWFPRGPLAAALRASL
ncbi:esterase, partial [Mycobacterium tuberculosis]